MPFAGTPWAAAGLILLAAAGGLWACAPSYPPQTAQEGSPPPGAVEPLAVAQWHMVAAAHPLAAEAGRDMLRRGGNAIDAAIAAQMVLNLVEPQSSGIGGGGFLVHYDRAAGALAVYDGRETAPASAKPEMFLDANGRPREFFDAAVGGLSVGVPGLLRMLEDAHQEAGRLPWAELFAPAIALAEGGFPVSRRLHEQIAEDRHLKTFADAAAYFFDSRGEPWPVDTRLTNFEFARVLREIASDGADAFYVGPIADDIVATVSQAGRNPAALTAADLAGYRAERREAICAGYRRWRLCGAPPPTSGGITSLQIMTLLERFDLPAMAPAMAPATGPRAGLPAVEAVHAIAEASRLAFADRNAFIADPAFVRVPLRGLLDPGYLASRSRLIGERAAGGEVAPGSPPLIGTLGARPADTADLGLSTSHISVVDADGNAVSMTTSIESTFGSRLMVRGFLLNNQLTDFSFVPEQNGAPVANRVEPGKRPRSSMAPTLVFDGNGALKMVVGSPGGSRIIGFVAKTLVAVLDWQLPMQAAIDLGNFGNRNGPTELERGTPLIALQGPLESRGHRVILAEMGSGVNAILVTPGQLQGGADRRREGIALGD